MDPRVGSAFLHKPTRQSQRDKLKKAIENLGPDEYWQSSRWTSPTGILLRRLRLSTKERLIKAMEDLDRKEEKERVVREVYSQLNWKSMKDRLKKAMKNHVKKEKKERELKAVLHDIDIMKDGMKMDEDIKADGEVDASPQDKRADGEVEASSKVNDEVN